MNQRLKKGFTGLCLIAFFIALVGLMVLRLGFPHLPRIADDITQFISERTNLHIEIGALQTHWQGAYPVFDISDLRITDNKAPSQLSIVSSRVNASVDLFRSLRYWQPIFKYADVDGLKVRLVEPESGWTQSPAKEPNAQISRFNDLLNKTATLLFTQSHIDISNAEFELMLAGEEVRRFSPVTLAIDNTRKQHQVVGQARLETEQGKNSEAAFVIEADQLSPSRPLDGEFSIYAKVSDVGTPILDLAGELLPIEISQLDASAELWATLSKRELSRLQGRASVDKLSFADEKFDNVIDSSFTFAAEPKGNNRYQIQVSSLTLVSDHTPADTLSLPYVTAMIQLPAPNSETEKGALALKQLAIQSLPLDSIAAWLKDKAYLTDSLNQAVDLLNPKGRLENVLVTWPDGAALSDFEAVADLVGVGLDEYFGSPSVANVNGQLVFNKNTGHVDLDTDQFDLSFPSLFESGWHYSHAKGRVKWNIERPPGYDLPVVVVNSGLLTLSKAAEQGEEATKDLEASGRFRLMLPIERKHQSEFSLMIGLQNGEASQAAGYVPAKEVGESLHAWIKQAVKSGTVKQGLLLLRTDTRNLEGRTPPTVQLYLDIEQGKVAFLEGWPAVSDTDMTLWLDQEGLRIRSEDANIMRSAGNVEITSSPDVSRLSIKTHLSGAASDIQQILNTPDIRQVVGDGLESWRISGSQTTDVSVDIALEGQQPPKVQVVSYLKGGSFKDKAQTLAFTKINGTLRFSSAAGLSAKGLKSEFLGSPVVGNIETVAATSESPAITRVSLNGTLSAAALHKWTGLSFLNSVKGAAAVAGRMDICDGSPLCNKLVVNTDLKGVELLLPAPYGKSSSDIKSLQLVGQLGINDPVWRFNLNNQLRGVTKMMGDLAGTRIFLGDTRPQEPSTPGVWVEGRQGTIDLDELSALLKRNEWVSGASADPAQTQSQTSNAPVTVSLMIDQVLYENMRLPRVNVVYHLPVNGRATIGVISPVVTGDIKIPEDDQQPYQISLKHLRLNTQGKGAIFLNQPESSSSEAPLMDVSQWPKMDVVIDELRLNSHELGRWQAALVPGSQGQFTVSSITADIGSYHLTGEAGWSVQNKAPQSYLDLSFAGGDLGKVIAQWGYSGVIESTKGNLSAKLSWPGYLWGFTPDDLSGNFVMSLTNGRIVESGNSANILRLFGILNFNTIVRRLKLNFTDLVEKGVAYDTLDASFLINDGIAYTGKPLSLEGPSADLKLNGELNLAQQTINAKMDVVLPLTSNVPIAAVLLGAPQIAGAVFIIDKLIGDKLEKVSTLTYQLNGPWAEPEVDTVVSEKEKQRNDPFRMDRNDK